MLLGENQSCEYGSILTYTTQASAHSDSTRQPNAPDSPATLVFTKPNFTPYRFTWPCNGCPIRPSINSHGHAMDARYAPLSIHMAMQWMPDTPLAYWSPTVTRSDPTICVPLENCHLIDAGGRDPYGQVRTILLSRGTLRPA